MACTHQSGCRTPATTASRRYVVARWVTGDGVVVLSRRSTTSRIDGHRATVGTSIGGTGGINIARS